MFEKKYCQKNLKSKIFHRAKKKKKKKKILLANKIFCLFVLHYKKFNRCLKILKFNIYFDSNCLDVLLEIKILKYILYK